MGFKNKLFKTVISLALVTATAVTGIGCGDNGGGGEGNRTEDATKTVLRVAHYNGGFGNDWLDKAIARFEDKYATYVNPTTGKTGVQVLFDDTAKNAISVDLAGNNHVVINESVDIYQEYSKLLDISDIFDDELEGDTNPDRNTIQEKLLPGQADALKINGSYYAVPHYQTFGGATYDVDLFEEEGFYFNKSGVFVPKNWNGDRSVLSNGPDGIPETYDDGLPSNYDEFEILLNKISSSNTPLLWAGQNKNYSTYLLTSMYLSLAGKQVAYNFSFNSGEDKINLYRGGTLAITESNAYRLKEQLERYQALEMFKKIIDNEDYLDYDCNNGSIPMTSAQLSFVEGSTDPDITGSGKRIAMLVEGNYWTNESSSLKQEEYKNNRYAHFPMPTVTGNGAVTKGENSYTLVDQAECFMAINKSAVNGKQDMIGLAKEFIKFCCTDVSLQEFTTTTNTTKALNYELTTEQLDKLTYHGKDIYNAKKRALENGVLFYSGSASQNYRTNAGDFSMNNGKSFWKSSKGSVPFVTMYQKSVTAAQYFEGMKVSGFGG